MQLRKLGATGIEIAPLVLGGNVFGWTADKAASFEILDTFLEAGFNAIDTADVYNRNAPGLKGGESETVLGGWIKDRGIRDRVVVITKGGLPMVDGIEGLGRGYLPRACEASLKRLQTDYIDIYMSHRADPNTPIAETLEVFEELIRAGKVRHAGCSNYTAQEIEVALAAAGPGLARYQVVEPRYNLISREEYEKSIEAICTGHGLGVITYYALASGFLTGKYRSEKDVQGRARARVLSTYTTPQNFKLLDALDRVSARPRVSPAQISLAWIMARPSVAAPIASATNVQQLSEILNSANVQLTAGDLAELSL